MTTTTTDPPEKLMTTEEFLALPDDGIERMLIRAVVHEIGPGGGELTRRAPAHGFAVSNVTGVLGNWAVALQKPRGRVYCGGTPFRIRHGPDTLVDIDVAYVDADVAERTPKNAVIVEGASILAVEVLSPSDKLEYIWAKVQDYLDAGTQYVWVVDPGFETVSVYRPDVPPTMLNADQELTAEPHLPGFRCRVGELFGR